MKELIKTCFCCKARFIKVDKDQQYCRFCEDIMYENKRGTRRMMIETR